MPSDLNRYRDVSPVIRAWRWVRHTPHYIIDLTVGLTMWVLWGMPTYHVPLNTRRAMFDSICTIAKSRRNFAMGRWKTVDEIFGELKSK